MKIPKQKTKEVLLRCIASLTPQWRRCEARFPIDFGGLNAFGDADTKEGI